jgi:hypothetical protein
MTDAWTLDPDEPDWLEQICHLLLEVGVPPTALSRAFRVDVDAIKELQSNTHVEKYGTAEISEAMYFLMWKAYEDAQHILTHAPIQIRMRFITTLLSRQSAIIGKESPQALEQMRAELTSLIAGVSVEDTEVPSIYATSSEFTALDGEADDPEEGLES